jgi:hypothetical protein
VLIKKILTSYELVSLVRDLLKPYVVNEDGVSSLSLDFLHLTDCLTRNITNTFSRLNCCTQKGKLNISDKTIGTP